jgi:peptidoglycan/xylan/chitin deacetylase (PgdA/CDA1 family)
LTLYYHGSYPIRWWQHRAALADDRVPVAIVFYHRVADDRANSWTVSNRNFVRQIRWLGRHFDLISLAEAQERIRSRANRRPSVSITFDDGYAENCHAAIPLLIKEKIPCTYFVTLRNILTGDPFEHDRCMGNRFPVNTMEQLQAMAAAGIDIGAHTYSHPDLATIDDPKRLYYEVASAGEDLQQTLGHPVRYFAFPFGQHRNLNPAAFQIAYEAGYDAVCSAYGGFNFPGDDAFHLQRIPIDDDMIRMKNWVTVDPRKLRTPRYHYERPAESVPTEQLRTP